MKMGLVTSELVTPPETNVTSTKLCPAWPGTMVVWGERRKRSISSLGNNTLPRSKRADNIHEACNEEIFCWAKMEDTSLDCDVASVALKEALDAVQGGNCVPDQIQEQLVLVKEQHCRQSVKNAVAEVLKGGKLGDLYEVVGKALDEANEVQSCKIKEGVIEAVKNMREYPDNPTWTFENESHISDWLRSMGEDGLKHYVSMCSGGEASQAKIKGGFKAQEGDWKSAAAIYKDNKFICGATIVNRDTIVTAAHCLAGYVKDGGGFYTVRAGMLRKQSSSPWEQQRFIKEVITNPDYDNIFLSHDVALAKLNESLAMNRAVQITCLPQHEEMFPAVGSTCRAAGWGDLSEQGQESQELMTGQVPVRATCTRCEFDHMSNCQ